MSTAAEPMNDPIEATELEHTADWRIKKLGENPADAQSAAAAKLLQRLADEVRALRGSPVFAEYLAILNWLGEFDVAGDYPDLAFDYRMRIGIDLFPENGEAYLRSLTALAKATAGV